MPVVLQCHAWRLVQILLNARDAACGGPIDVALFVQQF